MSKLQNIYYIFQIFFVMVIGGATLYNLHLFNKQSKLLNRPFVGVVDSKTTRLLKDAKQDTYDSVVGLRINFIIENGGSIAATNLKIQSIAKIGNVKLSHKEGEKGEGIVLMPRGRATNTGTVSKDVLERILPEKQGNERLIYSINISYSDMEGYNAFDYTTYYEVKIITKEPLTAELHLVPKPKE